jgi:hypothetical protein
MAKSKKLTEQELKQVQSMLNAFNQLKMQLGDVVLQQRVIIENIDKVKADYSVVEKELTEKYGDEAVINPQTGEVTEKAQETLEKVE